MNHKTADNKVSVPSYFKTNVVESATTVYVYNEYFVNGSDSFANIEMPDQIIPAVMPAQAFLRNTKIRPDGAWPRTE